MRTNDEGERMTMPLLQTARTDREFIEAAQAGELGESHRDAATGAITAAQNFPGDWTDATIAETIRQEVAANDLVVVNVPDHDPGRCYLDVSRCSVCSWLENFGGSAEAEGRWS